MQTLEELASNDEIKAEYKKAILLSIFKKLCLKMKNSTEYNRKIRNIFKQSYDQKMTIQLVVEKDFQCTLNDEESEQMLMWFRAHLKMGSSRKKIPIEVKKELYKKQKGVCVSCGAPLGEDLSKIHVDHIIPWVLVGDELPDNYQDLCDTCNECKSSRIDYMISRKLNLI